MLVWREPKEAPDRIRSRPETYFSSPPCQGLDLGLKGQKPATFSHVCTQYLPSLLPHAAGISANTLSRFGKLPTLLATLQPPLQREADTCQIHHEEDGFDIPCLGR